MATRREITDADIAILEQMRTDIAQIKKWKNSFRVTGAAYQNLPESMIISIPPPSNGGLVAGAAGDGEDRIYELRITSNIDSQGGRYNAKKIVGVGKADATGDLAEEDLGTASDD